LLLSGYGYAPAQALPEHGLYHPDLEQDAGIADWLTLRARAPAGKPAVGLILYLCLLHISEPTRLGMGSFGGVWG
ncbi:hypothetical protein, partial [Herbaspirillum frisingense]|uniref:hypothetical protein n=1 Tax=Herbaspirillum frisingense TaxID=92645 RepID=UPI0039B0A038